MGDRPTPPAECASNGNPTTDFKRSELSETNNHTPLISETDNEHLLRRRSAVRTIEKWWGGIRDRRVFKLFKQAVCGAESSFTRDIIRKLNPSDAALLQDPAVRARVKFRLGGECFPPIILYKIFFSKDLIHVQYMSGKAMIRPSTEAAEDASRQMSSRAMFDQMIMDACYHPNQKIQDEMDVVTVKDYMQYRSIVDESPAYIGGKGNSWRMLNASSLPRHSTMHSIAELLAKVTNSAPGSLTVPSHYVHSPRSSILGSSQKQARSPPSVKSGRTSSRRSWQARERVEKMRQNYTHHNPITTPIRETVVHAKDNEENDESDWENDALMLYQWTKGL